MILIHIRSLPEHRDQRRCRLIADADAPMARLITDRDRCEGVRILASGVMHDVFGIRNVTHPIGRCRLRSVANRHASVKPAGFRTVVLDAPSDGASGLQATPGVAWSWSRRVLIDAVQARTTQQGAGWRRGRSLPEPQGGHRRRFGSGASAGRCDELRSPQSGVRRPSVRWARIASAIDASIIAVRWSRAGFGCSPRSSGSACMPLR